MKQCLHRKISKVELPARIYRRNSYEGKAVEEHCSLSLGSPCTSLSGVSVDAKVNHRSSTREEKRVDLSGRK